MKKQLQTIRNAITKIAGISFLLLSLGVFNANAQLTGTKNIPGNYATLAAAIADLNTLGVGPGGVTFNLIAGNPQAAPAGGYIIGGTGSAILSGPAASSLTSPITFTGNANVITASGAQIAGSRVDAIFQIIGGDWITLQGFTLQENVANATTALASNTMTEFGVALFYVSATDGAKNNTIQNNIISLSNTYQNSIALYSNTTHTATVPGTAANATSTTGLNTDLKIYGNTITDVAYGIYIASPPNTATVTESGLDIGGTSSSTANTITFGVNTATDAAWNAFTAVPAGISYRTGTGASVRYNTITSNTMSLAVAGIYFSAATAPSGVTYTNTISNNLVTLTQTSTNTATGIDFGYGIAAGTMIGSNNKVILNQPATVTVAGALIGIKANYTSGTKTFTNDTVTINQTFSPATALTNSSAITGITLVGTATTVNATSNGITVNQLNSPSAAITSTLSSAILGLGVGGSGSTVNALNNTILIARSTLMSAGATAAQSGTITGIQATTASTLLNIGSSGNGNMITLKEDTSLTGGTSTWGSGVNYVDVTAAHTNSNVVANTFNTTGSQIFSTGTLNCITVGSSQMGGLDNRKGNTALINRVAASGQIYFSFTSGTPSEPNDTISSNSITFIGLRGTTSITAINAQGGASATGTSKNINNNIISITGTHNGTTVGITNQYSYGNVAYNDITISSLATTLTGINLTTSTGAYTVTGNALNLTSSSVGSLSITGISGTATGPYQFFRNTLANLSSNGGGAAAATITGITLSVGTGNNIFSNVFTNLSTSGSAPTGNTTITAISITGGTSTNIDSNQITNISTAASSGNGTIIGISISGGTTNNIYKNNIYNLSTGCLGTATLISGIRLSGGTTNNVYNNLISQGNALVGVNSVDAIRGINITSTSGSTTHNIYYNSIYLNASSTGTDFGTTGVFHTVSGTATTSVLNLRNNLIINTSTPSGAGLIVALRRSAGAATNLANYAATSNNNNLYAGSPSPANLIYSDGVSTAQTMASYQSGAFTAGTIAPRDASSFSENPTFKSVVPTASNFLRIDTLIITQMESGGANIATYTRDYGASVRAGNPGYGAQVNGGGSNPDIGAWEFDGLAASPAISNVSVSPVQCIAAQHTVSATILPNVGIITSANINYSYNGTPQTPIVMTNTSGNIWQGDIPAATTPTNAAVTFSITATNSSSLSATKSGTGYSDDPLNGKVVVVTSSSNPVCLGGSATLTGLVSSASTAVPSGYTLPTYATGTGSGDWISKVIINGTTLSNLTAGAGAPYYTLFPATGSTTTSINAGQTYTLQVAGGTFGTCYVSVWLDTNRDGIFSAAEFLGVSPNCGASTTVSFNITIPAGAALGSTYLRLRSSDTGPGPIATEASGATNSAYGEGEDYIVSVSGNAGFTFSWSNGISTIGSTSSITVSPIATTNYTVTATDANSCSISNAVPYTQNIINTTLSGTYTVGTSGTYATISSAIDAYNTACTISGPIVFELLDATYNATSGEVFPLTIKGNNQASATKTLTIRPAAGITSTVSGKSTAIFRLDSAKFVTIDGRQGGSGTPKSLTIQNDSTIGGAIQFINDAKRNLVQYADLRGASTDPTIGVVNFNTGLVNGNDSITIDNCDIHEAISTPASLVQSLGATANTAVYNDYITISNCNLYNFWNAAAEGNAFKISNGNNNWTITGNSIYQTAPRTGTTGYYIFNFQHGGNYAALNGMIVTNNSIGGSAPLCGGTPWVQTGGAANQNTYFNMGNVVRSKFNNNRMSNFDFTTTSTSAGGAGAFNMVQYINGMLDIDSNTFGSMTDSNSIVVVAGNGGAVIAISAGASNTAGTYSISANKIGGVKVSGGTSNSNSIAAISITTAGSNITYKVDNNIIGNTLANNIIAWPSNGSGVQGVIGILNSSSANLLIRNNTIRNLTNFFYGTVGNSVTSGINSSAGIDTITGNNIYALANGASGQSNADASAAITGISCSQSTAGNLISQNKIYGLLEVNTGTSTVNVNGINVSGSMTASIVSKNLIHSLTTAASGIAAGVTGINYGGGTITVVNNMIRLGLDTTGTSMTTTPAIRGIHKKGGNISAYFNSVYIGGTGAGTGVANTYAFVRTTTGTDAAKNNIFMNERSNAVAGNGNGGAHFAFGTNDATTFASDYNLYYVNSSSNGDTLAQFGSTPYSSMALWKNTVGLDGNSISGNPSFASPTGDNTSVNIHISGATPIEAAGIPIAGITDDYDGDVRASLTPTDLGADAGNFTLSDISGPAISYAALSIDTVSTQRILNGVIAITDPSNVNVTTNKPRIYYKKKNDANVFSGNTSSDNGWKYVDATNTTSPFNFIINYSILNGGSIVVGDTIHYFVVAQDALANIGANPGAGLIAGSVTSIIAAPTTPNQYIIKSSPLRGTYLVGAAQIAPNFTTLTAAIAKLNDVGVAAPVDFRLTDAFYDEATETYPVVINTVLNGSSTNTVTIRPAASANPTLTGATISAFIKLNGADNVIIDGSNNGTTSRNLTFNNSNTSTTNSGGIWIASATSLDGANNNTVKNCNIIGNDSTTTLAGIFIGGTSSIGSSTNALMSNSRNRFVNNSISKFQYGIWAIGASTSILDTANMILQNQLGQNGGLGLEGVFVMNQTSDSISNNSIANIGSAITGLTITEANGVISPIWMRECKNMVVSANTITNLAVTGGSSINFSRLYGICSDAPSFASSGNASNNLIVNNAITKAFYDGAGTGWNICGIVLHGGYGDKIYFNTVYLSGTGFKLSSGPSALFANGTSSTTRNATNIDLRNNILVAVGTGLSGNFYGHYTSLTSYTGSTVDKNNIYVNMTGVTPFIASLNGTNQTALSAWVAAASVDINSINDSTRFVSSSNAHLAAGSIGNYSYKGAPIVGITTDIDGQIRNSIPYIGSDENTSSPLPVTLASFTARTKDADAVLSWTTVSEINNQGFEVQRSVDGKNFEKIDFVKGAGNTTKQQNYYLTDARAFARTSSNTLYYRLKQVDFDNKYTYSQIVRVTHATALNNELSIYPNPFISDYKVTYTAANEGTGSIEMLDMFGKVVAQQTITFLSGSNTASMLELSELSSGIYFVRLTIEGESQIFKLLKTN